MVSTYQLANLSWLGPGSSLAQARQKHPNHNRKSQGPTRHVADCLLAHAELVQQVFDSPGNHFIDQSHSLPSACKTQPLILFRFEHIFEVQ